MEDMLERYCGPEARVHRNALLVRDLQELAVPAMAACVVRVLGSQSPEKVSGGQMQLVERVLAGVYYAWGQMFLTCVQRQLTAAKESGNGFCYGSFLCAFFMERVPTLRPWVPVRAGGLREPRMVRWGEMMRRRGGGDVGCYFTQELYLQ